MSRFLTLDWYYPEAFAAAAKHPGGIFDFSHGTSDFMDIALRAAGHEAETLVVNADPHWQLKVADYKPTHIISQNVGMWGAYPGSPLDEFRRLAGIKLIGFCSYAAVDQTLTGWDVLFSSFKWMPEHCAALGQKCHYLPLAFGKPVLKRLRKSCTYCEGTGFSEDPMEGRGAPVGAVEPCPKCNDVKRDIPVAFIGGLGSRIWDKGTATMAHIAGAVPEFRWWGYKVGALPESLERTYQGQAWGLDYYRLLHRIDILMNRHGEIARGFGNNMRQYESIGCGAHLVTDNIGELRVGDAKMCDEYESAKDALMWIDMWQRYKLRHTHRETMRKEILACHTYESRIPRFLEVVESL